MAEKLIIFSIRLIALIIYLYSIYWQYVSKRAPFISKERKEFGQFIYMTYWDLLIQTGFFLLIILNYIFNSKKLKNLIDTIYFSLAFPLSLIVSITFWSLYLYDRELILPTIMDPYFPTWLNHSTHSMIALLTIMELFVEKRKQSSIRKNYSIFMSTILIYALWTIYLRYYKGFWVYPFMDKLNLIAIIIFYLLSSILYSICFFICSYIGRLVNGNNNSESLMMMKKKTK